MADGNYRNNAPRPERARHSLNDFRFRLTGERLEGATKPCQLGFDIDRDGIRFTGFTNVQGDKDNGMIRASLSLTDAAFVATLLEQAPRLAPGTHREVVIAGNVFDRQKNTRSMRQQATLHIGRKDDGVIYIAYASWERTRPVVKIDMLPSNFIRLVDPATGQPAPADKVSELMAIAWAKSMVEMFPMVMNQEYARVNEKFLSQQAAGGGQRQGGGGGGYNGGGQRQGGYSGGGSGGAPAGGGNSYGGGGFDNDFGGDDLPM